MPPMPPIPGAPIGISAFSSFLSQMTHSVVKNMPAIEAAFSKAHESPCWVDDTPSFHVLVFVLTGIVTEVAFSLAYFFYNHRTFQTCVLHNLAERFFDGAFYDIDTCGFVCIGTLQAFQSLDARIYATPPPGMIPSSIAARVAHKASSTRSFFSFISTSLGAPT